MRVRYLIRRDGPEGRLPRYFWQPSRGLREAGFRPRRVPDTWRDLVDPEHIEAAAIAAAQKLNAELDRWRQGRMEAGAAQAPKPTPVAERTVAALIADYKAGRHYRALAPKTRYEYSNMLRIIEGWCGAEPLRAMNKARLVRLYEDLYPRTPAQANAVMRVARLLFAHATRQGWRHDNPAEKLGLIGLEKTGRIWPREAVTAFVAAADRMDRHSIGTAVLLNEWLGQREADLLALPRNLLDPRGLVIHQRKTRARVALPIASVPPLVARIEAELARQAERGCSGLSLLLCETTGKPWGADHFRHEFAAIRTALAAETPRFAVDYVPRNADPAAADAFTMPTRDLWFMHLRHTAVVRLAEAGATIAEIAAITGHRLETVNKTIEHYLVRTAPQAAAAFQKRLEREKVE
jgi:hypothetical protein